jgi:imidazolonepropionase-like amidohydrolase
VTAPSRESTSAALHVRGVVLPEQEHRDLWIVAGRVTYEPVRSATTIAEGYVVPGLVDAHCHIGLGPNGPVRDKSGQEEQAIAVRDAGALLVRDCGSPVDTRWIDDRPDLPRVIRAGRHLARTRRYLPGVGVELEPGELPDAAELQAKVGDGWVKLVGDWIDRERRDLAPCWPAASLTAAIARAHDAGARVTAHTFSEEALPGLLAAGIDCLEHGTGLDDDLIALMASRGTALVPTLINIDNFPAIADRGAAKYPAYADHMRRLYARSRDVVRSAYDAGVPVYAGSDAGGGIRHGRIVDEVRALAGAGLPADAALGAASWNARAWLGWPSLGEGDAADLLVCATDPLVDLGALSAPVRMLLRGRVVR